MTPNRPFDDNDPPTHAELRAFDLLFDSGILAELGELFGHLAPEQGQVQAEPTQMERHLAGEPLAPQGGGLARDEMLAQVSQHPHGVSPPQPQDRGDHDHELCQVRAAYVEVCIRRGLLDDKAAMLAVITAYNEQVRREARLEALRREAERQQQWGGWTADDGFGDVIP